MEGSQEGFEAPEKTEEDAFRAYFEGLDLHQEDFSKKILDVGSGSAKFAKWAKEHGVSDHIYSIDPFAESRERQKSVRARVEQLPFGDGSFDLVVSLGAIPQVFISAEYDADRKERIKQGLSEMLRVGGEVRIGDYWPRQGLNEYQKNFDRLLKEILGELNRERGVAVEEVSLPGRLVSVEVEGNSILAPMRLIKLRKPIQHKF